MLAETLRSRPTGMGGGHSILGESAGLGTPLDKSFAADCLIADCFIMQVILPDDWPFTSGVCFVVASLFGDGPNPALRASVKV